MTENVEAYYGILLGLADRSTGEVRECLEFAAGFIRMYDVEADDALNVFLEDREAFGLTLDERKGQ